MVISIGPVIDPFSILIQSNQIQHLQSIRTHAFCRHRADWKAAPAIFLSSAINCNMSQPFCFGAGAALLAVTQDVTNWESFQSGVALQGWMDGSPCDWTRVVCNDDMRVASL